MREGFGPFLQAKGLAPLTLRAYLYDVALFQRYPLATDQATKADILSWCSWYRTHASQSSLVRRFAAIKHYYGWLIERGLRDTNPCEGIRLKHPSAPVKDPFTEGELRRILDACKPHRPHERAIVLLLVDAGLRLAEISGIRLGNIDFERQLIRVRGKGDKERMLAFGSRTLVALLSCVDGRDYLWPSQRTHAAMTRDGVSILLHRLGKRTGIRVHAHRFRTTFAIMFDERTHGDTGSLQVLMGHSKVSTTLLYIQHGRQERALKRQREVSLADGL